MSTETCFLNSSDNYFQWLKYIRCSVSPDEWKFYDPERTITIDNEVPENPTPGDLKNGATKMADLSASDRTYYLQLRQEYREERERYEKRVKEEKSLWERILKSVNVCGVYLTTRRSSRKR